MTTRNAIREIASLTMGLSPSGETYNKNEEGLPLLNGPTEFGDSYPIVTMYTTDSKRECECDDLIFCVRGSTTGRMNWADKKYSLGRGVCSIRGHRKELTKVIRYNLDYRLEELLKLAGGGTFPNLRKEDIETFPIILPENLEGVVSFISAFDDLIENNTKRIKILEETARVIYGEWFVHYRFPNHEKVKMVDSGTGRGEVPEGWEHRQISDMANVLRGRSYKGSELADQGGLPFLNLKCFVRDGGFREDGIKRYTGEYKSKQTAKAGDIIMAVTDMTQDRRVVARAARVPKLEEPLFVFSMDTVKIEPNENVPKEYLYSMFRFSDFADAVKQHANGANVLHLNPASIENHIFLCPLEEVMKSFSNIVSPIFALADCLSLTNTKLRQTRDLLLPKLISGQLAVV